MKQHFKKIISLTFIFILLVLCGCTGNFKPIEPPINEFPVPNDYQVAEIITGSFVAEKSFRGNFKYEGLYSMESSLLNGEFKVGEKGIIEYEVDNKIIKVEATLALPQGNSSAYMVARHNNQTDIGLKYNWPGRFYIVIYQKDNCILAPKNSVFLLDDSGNAFVCVEGENGILLQKEIKVGESNNKYYHVLEGLEAGEKVVLK